MTSYNNWCILPFPFCNFLRYLIHVARLSINGLLGMWLGLLAFYFKSPKGSSLFQALRYWGAVRSKKEREKIKASLLPTALHYLNAWNRLEGFPKNSLRQQPWLYVYYQCVCFVKSTINPSVYIKKVKLILVVSWRERRKKCIYVRGFQAVFSHLWSPN